MMKILLLDIDGTLFGYNGKREEYHPELPGLLTELIAAGTRIGPVTGRPYAFSRKLYSRLGMNGPLVTEMGGILDLGDGNPQVVNGFDEALRRRIEEFVKAHQASRRLGMRLERDKVSMVSVVHESFPDHDPAVLEEYFRLVSPAVQEAFPDADVTHDSYSIDIYSTRVNKRTTLERMDRLLPGEKSYIAAGDSVGDIPLFEFAESRNGTSCYVGEERGEEFLARIRRASPRIIIPQQAHSTGLVEFLASLLRGL